MMSTGHGLKEEADAGLAEQWHHFACTLVDGGKERITAALLLIAEGKVGTSFLVGDVEVLKPLDEAGIPE